MATENRPDDFRDNDRSRDLRDENARRDDAQKNDLRTNDLRLDPEESNEVRRTDHRGDDEAADLRTEHTRYERRGANVRAIAFSGMVLVVLAVLIHLLVAGLFNSFRQHYITR